MNYFNHLHIILGFKLKLLTKKITNFQNQTCSLHWIQKPIFFLVQVVQMNQVQWSLEFMLWLFQWFFLLRWVLFSVSFLLFKGCSSKVQCFYLLWIRKLTFGVVELSNLPLWSENFCWLWSPWLRLWEWKTTCNQFTGNNPDQALGSQLLLRQFAL